MIAQRKKQTRPTAAFEFPTLSKMNANDRTSLRSTLIKETSLSSEAHGIKDSKLHEVKRMC